MNRFSERVEVIQRRLSRKRIEGYIALVQSAFLENYGISLDVEHEGVEINASSFDELASNPRVPDTLSNLSIRVWEPKVYQNVRQIQKEIDFSINNSSAYVVVEGVDETWVVGSKERLQRFFNEDQPGWYKLIPIFSSRFTLSVILGVWLVFTYHILSIGTIIWSILYAVASSYLLLTYSSWATWSSGGGYRVFLRKAKREVFGMSPREYIPILISLLTLLLTGIRVAISMWK